MDKATIKLHKMNIFPKVPPLYTHLLSTFLPVFSGTMLPNGLPVSCLPPRTAFPPIVGATIGRPHVSGVICTCRDRKKGRPMAAPTIRHFYIIRRKNVIAYRHAASLPPDCHSLPPRRPPLRHRKRVSPGNATTNKRHPRTKREVRGAPNPISKKGGMPTRGIPPFLELLMGFGPMTSSLPMTCSTD